MLKSPDWFEHIQLLQILLYYCNSFNKSHMKKRIYTLIIACSFLGISLSKAQIISTVAGNGVIGFSGDGGQATSAKLNKPTAVAFDASGNMYIADWGGNVIRKISTTGIITTVAGTGYGVDSINCSTCYSGDGGLATNAKLSLPNGMAFDASGNLYFADEGNNRVRMINTAGIITTVVGTGGSSFYGDGGFATAAQISSPGDVKFDGLGNMYIADAVNQRIRKVNTSGIISTIAGSGFGGGYAGNGGQATSANLNSPNSIAFDAAGNIYITDYFNYVIRKVNISTGIITTIAGNGTQGYSGDNVPATSAQFVLPQKISFDAAGNLYVADQVGVIRKIDTSGIITTVVGDTVGSANNTAITYSGDGGAAYLAHIGNPQGVAFDAAGNMYIADFDNSRIRRVTNCSNPIYLTSTSLVTTCSGRATPLAISGANSYTWSPSIGLNNANSASPIASLTATTIYTVTGIDASANCIALAYDTVNIALCLVWPGDANEDIVVDNNDLLTLGLKYGRTGPARSTVTNIFNGYPCNNWSDTLANGFNTKYADCNGDGNVNMDDTLAINNNIETAHYLRLAAPKHKIIQSINPDIFLSFNKTVYFPGDTVKADINIGSGTNTQSNFYGAAFNIQYDESQVKSGTDQFWFANSSWVGNINQNTIKFNYLDFYGNVRASLVRINHTDINGYGKVASFQYVLKDTVNSNQLYFTITNAVKVNQAGVSTVLNTGTDSVAAVSGITGVKQVSGGNNQITVYPNPATTNLSLNLPEKKGTVEFQITNLLGQEVKHEILYNIQHTTVDVSNLPNGVYFISVTTGGSLSTKKFTINH